MKIEGEGQCLRIFIGARAGGVPLRREADARRGARETREVRVELERRAGVRPDHLVDAVAIEEAAVEDRDLRVLGGDERAVEVHERAVHALDLAQQHRAGPRPGGPPFRRYDPREIRSFS